MFSVRSMRALARADNYVKALGGEALCLLLEEESDPPEYLLRKYEGLLLEGVILVPYRVIFDLAGRLDSECLKRLGERIRLLEAKISHSLAQTDFVPDAQLRGVGQPIVEIRRFVHSTFIDFTPATAAEMLGVRKSVFRSEQERTFLRAVSLRFPALCALPNYPLDQIIDLAAIRKRVGEKVWTYGKNCRVDTVLVLPDVGSPVAVFELDSGHHDKPAARVRDAMKNTIFGFLGLPVFRLRVESPNSMSVDEWFALLTEQVVPVLDMGPVMRRNAKLSSTTQL